MNKDFWKGVLTGAGGLLLVWMLLPFVSWLPWIALGAGGVYAVAYFSRRSKRLPGPSHRNRFLDD